MVGFLGFSIMLVLKEDFEIKLSWFDVYLPILIGDTFHLYHTFICFIRLRLQSSGVWDSVSFPHHQRCQFIKSFVFTLLIGLAKFFFYRSVEQSSIGDGMATKRYRTGSMTCLIMAILFLAQRNRN